MAFRLLDRVWDPPVSRNADGSSVSSDVVLLLDGAAPRGSARASTYHDDAVWLVRRFVELFRGQDDTPSAELGMPERSEQARLALRGEYDDLCRRAGSVPTETPFACLAIAHDNRQQIELWNMGDLTTLVRFRDGRVERHGESAVRELDRRALEHLRRELAAGVEPHAARIARVWPTLGANRAQRNRLPGYDVLDIAENCQSRFEHRAWPRGDVRELLMMSDGFYRLVDTFGRYTDASLFAALEQRGAKALLEELRALEEEDAQCVRALRFKAHDDATALWLGLDSPSPQKSARLRA
jgi:protein phosphatase 2C-like protein